MGIVSSNYSGGILTTKYDNAKLLMGNNSFEGGEVVNSDYEDLVIPGGTLMGRISATGKLVPLTSGASDGSQFPVGVSVASETIEFGDTKTVQVCVSGRINENELKLQGSDTLSTVISGRQLRDRIGGDTVGLILVSVDELGKFDND
jgi:hypothetical protein